jgi:hypothetical protein
VAEEEETETTEEGSVETSLEELLQRKERRGTATVSDDEDEEEALLEAMDEREGRAESLTVKVIPPQPTEFTCRKCFLLKHRSQLKDKRRMLCNDCG